MGIQLPLDTDQGSNEHPSRRNTIGGGDPQGTRRLVRGRECHRPRRAQPRARGVAAAGGASRSRRSAGPIRASRGCGGGRTGECWDENTIVGRPFRWCPRGSALTGHGSMSNPNVVRRTSGEVRRAARPQRVAGDARRTAAKLRRLAHARVSFVTPRSQRLSTSATPSFTNTTDADTTRRRCDRSLLSCDATPTPVSATARPSGPRQAAILTVGVSNLGAVTRTHPTQDRDRKASTAPDLPQARPPTARARGTLTVRRDRVPRTAPRDALRRKTRCRPRTRTR